MCMERESKYRQRASSSKLNECYSRQVAKYEQRNGGRGQVAGNRASCKPQGSTDRQRKAGTFRMTGNWMIRVPVVDKKRWGKAGISWVQMQTFSHCSPIFITIPLALYISTHLAPTPYFGNKLNEGKNPSCPRENGAGMKIPPHSFLCPS